MSQNVKDSQVKTVRRGPQRAILRAGVDGLWSTPGTGRSTMWRGYRVRTSKLRRSAMLGKLLWILLVIPAGGIGLKMAYC